ncbi:MAG: MarR family transcriptional regulator [Caldisphaeraceae archaeon]|nr:MarR family transcriptional regulator [Caldisphaeraceae archaeon]
MRNSMKVVMKIDRVAALLYSLNKRYITLREFSDALCISTRSAGRVLKRLERRGYLRRYSSTAYFILPPNNYNTYYGKGDPDK